MKPRDEEEEEETNEAIIYGGQRVLKGKDSFNQAASNYGANSTGINDETKAGRSDAPQTDNHSSQKDNMSGVFSNDLALQKAGTVLSNNTSTDGPGLKTQQSDKMGKMVIEELGTQSQLQFNINIPGGAGDGAGRMKDAGASKAKAPLGPKKKAKRNQ